MHYSICAISKCVSYERVSYERVNSFPYHDCLLVWPACAHDQLSCDFVWEKSAGTLHLLHALLWQLLQKLLPALNDWRWGNLACVSMAQVLKKA